MVSTALLVFHVILTLFLSGLVLFQPDKSMGLLGQDGAGIGASQTLFGSRGSSPFMTKLTSLVACLFFITSIGSSVFPFNKEANDIAPLFVRSDSISSEASEK
jgi:preprotein translocase subunit SecG